MENQKQALTVIFDNLLVYHSFLKYVPEQSKFELIARLHRNESIVAGFYNQNNDLIFIACFDFEENCLHVREVGGFFGKYTIALDTFCQGFAKFLKAEVITFNSNRKAIAKWAEKLDYRNFDNEYVKRIG